MYKKLALVTAFQLVIGLVVLSLSGASLKIVSALVLLAVLAVGNLTSYLTGEKDAS